LIGYRQTIKQPKGYVTMSKSNIVKLSGRAESSDPLTELLRQGAQDLIQRAVEAELSEYLQGFQGRRLEDGRAAVVRNGYQPERAIQTGIGPVNVKVPKIRAKDGKPVTFRSALVPPYVRKTRSLEAALPWLYLKGVSTGEMENALEVLVGPEAKGLSASTVARLKRQWADEYAAWRQSRLDKDRWVYLWADGIYSGLRAEDAKLCALVIIGVNERGQKHFLAIEDGVRESTQSWREVLLSLKARGMNTPKLAVGDGAMGFWAALDEVYGETRQQRCWMHKTGNILNYAPKSAQPKMKQALHDIWQAATRNEAESAFDKFERMYEPKYPKAVQCLQKDRDELMAFYDFPAQHWQSLRTTNPIESSFGTIRHRTKRSKGCLSRDGMLHMIFKLGECAQKNWRKQRGFHYLAKVVQGIKFRDGEEVIATDQKVA
jgi:transposase-like protein